MEQIIQNMKDARLDAEQSAILTQKRLDLAAIKERANRTEKFNQDSVSDTYNDETFKPRDLSPKVSSQITPGTPTSTLKLPLTLRKPIKIAVEPNESPSKTEWQRQKDQENAQHPAIDNMMEMIGLEDVKAQILKIKAKVETTIRQGTDLKKERFGLTLLGNPGTGKSFL